MQRHLALFTALALASADTEGELRLSLTYNDMADNDDSTTQRSFKHGELTKGEAPSTGLVVAQMATKI